MSNNFGSSVHFDGNVPVTLHKGTGEFFYPYDRKVVATWHEQGRPMSVGMDRDEVQTVVDFLIEALEEYDEANKPKPLDVEDLQVGGLYEVVEDNASHDFPIGTLVHYLGLDKDGMPIATRDLNVTEWQDCDEGYGVCRGVADGDLAPADCPWG